MRIYNFSILFIYLFISENTAIQEYKIGTTFTSNFRTHFFHEGNMTEDLQCRYDMIMLQFSSNPYHHVQVAQLDRFVNYQLYLN